MAAQWFGSSAEKKYKYAQYSLGALYHRGQGVDQDFQTAFALYLNSANQGFPYADFEAAKMYRDGVGTKMDDTKSKQHFHNAFCGFKILEKRSHDDKIQYRLGWMLQNGIGTDQDIMRAKTNYDKSAKMGNVFAGYSWAKLILSEEIPIAAEVQKAIGIMKSIVENDSSDYNSIRPLATYMLGRIYIEGKYVVKDINRAVIFLMKSAEENNQWASYQLGKLFLSGDEIVKDAEKAITYLTKSAEQGNQFAQYTLGMLFLLGKDVSRDKEFAIKWLIRAKEQGNEYARLFLENMDKSNHSSMVLSISRLMYHTSKIFEENMLFFDNSSKIKADSKLLKKLKEKKVAQGHREDEHSIKL